MLKKSRDRFFIMRLNENELFNFELLAEFEGRTKAVFLRWQLLYLYCKRFQEDPSFRERALEHIDPDVRREYSNQILKTRLDRWGLK